MKVAILCGGLGTRLGALTKDIPKPMIDVAGRPYLEYIIESFLEREFREFVLLTGYRSEVIEEHFAPSPLSFEFSREEEPLGTGGALLRARSLLGDRFLLTYGDVLRRYDYDRFVHTHERNCLAVYPRITTGNADIADGKVIRFDKSAPELPYIDAGFAVVESSVLDLLPAEGKPSFEEIVYPELARRGELACEVVDHQFFDIGTPEGLERTRTALERG